MNNSEEVNENIKNTVIMLKSFNSEALIQYEKKIKEFEMNIYIYNTLTSIMLHFDFSIHCFNVLLWS